MKKTLFFLLLAASGSLAMAQPDSITRKKSPAIINQKAIMTQSTTTPTTTPSLTPPKKVMQSVSGELAPPPTEGTDLRIVIDKMDDSSGATTTWYRVTYSIINAGTVDVDITNVGVQGLFNKIGTAINIPAGGLSLVPAYLNGRSILRPGESFQGKMNASYGGVFVDNPHKYVLRVDDNNRIAEANENNNTAERTIESHKQPDLIPTKLNVVYNTQLGRWEISYTLTNAGQSPIDLNYVHYQGYFDAVIPYGPPEGGCGAVMRSLSGPTMLNPGENYSGSFICSQNSLRSGKEYDYRLTFISSYPVPDLNVPNNTARVRVIAP